jgi:CheY-like chemotaxis protein
MMPEMTGMELCTQIRGLAPDLAERVVFLTGGAFTQTAMALLDVVPNRRLEKPLDAGTLREIIAELV